MISLNPNLVRSIVQPQIRQDATGTPGATDPTGAVDPTGTTADRGKVLLTIPGDHPFTLYEGDLDATAKRELNRLGDAAQGIEKIFMKKILEEMMPKDAMGSGAQADYVRDQFMDAISNQVAQRGAIGIANLLRQRLSDSFLRTEAAKRMMTTTVDEKA